jgi:DNA-3-methyladenine glycosylase I
VTEPGGAGPVVGADGLARCPLPREDPLYVAYHDREWGRPVTDERALFEKLVLEGFQAGLSWLVILRKREAFRAAFHGFDPERVAAFTDADVDACAADPAIVRNRAKITAAVGNARTLLALWERGRSLSELVWAHAPDPRPRPTSPAEVPATSPESRVLSRTLRQDGFAFVGPTAMYALMQAMGLVDDHLAGCHVPPEACGPRAAPG